MSTPAPDRDELVDSLLETIVQLKRELKSAKEGAEAWCELYGEKDRDFERAKADTEIFADLCIEKDQLYEQAMKEIKSIKVVHAEASKLAKIMPRFPVYSN